jgi:hypothetical protein
LQAGRGDFTRTPTRKRDPRALAYASPPPNPAHPEWVYTRDLPLEVCLAERARGATAHGDSSGRFAGYRGLTGMDEEGTHAQLKEHGCPRRSQNHRIPRSGGQERGRRVPARIQQCRKCSALCRRYPGRDGGPQQRYASGEADRVSYWHLTLAGSHSTSSPEAPQLGIEIFAPNAENGRGRASSHSLKDR